MVTTRSEGIAVIASAQMLPDLLIGWPLPGAALAELEYGPVPRAQLPDVARYSGSYLVAGALGLNV
jgi:hypothetical protein